MRAPAWANAPSWRWCGLAVVRPGGGGAAPLCLDDAPSRLGAAALWAPGQSPSFGAGPAARPYVAVEPLRGAAQDASSAASRLHIRTVASRPCVVPAWVFAFIRPARLSVWPARLPVWPARLSVWPARLSVWTYRCSTRRLGRRRATVRPTWTPRVAAWTPRAAAWTPRVAAWTRRVAAWTPRVAAWTRGAAACGTWDCRRGRPCARLPEYLQALRAGHAPRRRGGAVKRRVAAWMHRVSVAAWVPRVLSVVGHGRTRRPRQHPSYAPATPQSSAPVPPRGAPGGTGRLGTPRRQTLRRRDLWGAGAPRHCLGCSSEPRASRLHPR